MIPKNEEWKARVMYDLRRHGMSVQELADDIGYNRTYLYDAMKNPNKRLKNAVENRLKQLEENHDY